jgi:predicted MFS family arabinose efflux permease
MSVAAWRSAFLAIAGLMLLALIAFVVMRPRDLAGEKESAR